MARRGRKRKTGVARYKSGEICKDQQTPRKPDRIEPTPQMKRKKRETDGGEVDNPLSYLPLSHGERDALERYFVHRSMAGWGGLPKTAKLTEYIGGGREGETSDERAARIEQAFRAADRELIAAGPAAHRAVLSAFAFRGTGNRIKYTAALVDGARALARHYSIDWRDAA